MSNILHTLSDADLEQYLANAYVTQCQALGHTKTFSNERIMNVYREELIQRGYNIPRLGLFDDADEYKKELAAVGVFNGPGTI